MKPLLPVVLLAAILAAEASSRAQGTLRNLNFESPVLPLVPDPVTGGVPVTNGVPHWTAYIAGTPVDFIGYNDLALGAAAISIHDPNSPYAGLFGGVIQ